MTGSRTRLVVGALFTLTLVYPVSQADGAINRWTPLGLHGGYGLARATDPRPAGPVYLGTLIGLYRSLDDGATWQIQSDGVGTPTVPSLAIDPATPTTVYAGTSGDGVWKSTDDGARLPT